MARTPGMGGSPPLPPRARKEELFDGLAFADEPETPMKVKAPEPLKRVRVLDPYGVAHNGTAYFPGDIPEVPESGLTT